MKHRGLGPWQTVITILAALALNALGAGGCAKRAAEKPWPEWTPSPLVIVSESRDQLPDGQANVKLVVRGDATPATAEQLLRDYVDQHRRDDEEMWVSLFLEGMDVQSIEYAFAAARPGRPLQITVRESAQTYR